MSPPANNRAWAGEHPKSAAGLEEHRYKRSPWLVLSWDGPRLVATDCNSLRRFRGVENLIGLLSALADWQSPSQVAHTLGTADGTGLNALLDDLVEKGLVLTTGDPCSAAPLRHEGAWDLIELAMQRQSARGGAAPRRRRPPRRLPPVRGGEPTRLPRVPSPSPLSVVDALERRRSVRHYDSRPLLLEEIAAFLYSTARSSTDSPPRRPYPSGGACYPLELYLLANDVATLQPGAYHYCPDGHELRAITTTQAWQTKLNRFVLHATDQALNRTPPVVFVVTAVFERVTWKYRRISLSLILKEVGCLFQTMYLVATAMGLAPCAIGSGGDLEDAAALGMDPFLEAPVGLFLLGAPYDAEARQNGDAEPAPVHSIRR